MKYTIKEKQIETNGIPNWENIPKDIADAFLSALEKIIFGQLAGGEDNEI